MSVRKTKGGVVSSVREGSLADEIGILEGDQIVSIDGHLLRDLIDYQYFSAEESFCLNVRSGHVTKSFIIDREYGRDLGIEFVSPVFDGIRTCSNKCEFCFVRQMAPGLRSSLYVRDDDYRYSFLYGSFITLTNLTQPDWDRIEEQRLSPLYVSVHATDLEVRRGLLCNPSAPDVISQLQQLGNAGIVTHCQIVVNPGVNDRAVLDQTITDLVELWPTVESVGIVPVGLTKYAKPELRPLTREDARLLVTRYGADSVCGFRRKLGVGLVYLSDELYFLAGAAIPEGSMYDDYPQLENGVGMTRLFLDEWSVLMSNWEDSNLSEFRVVSVVCGVLFSPVLHDIAKRLSDLLKIDIVVRVVVNEFFGDSVTVSGLLTGEDVVAALRSEDLGEVVVLPRAMFDQTGSWTLDDWSIEELSKELNVEVRIAGSPEELLLCLSAA